MDTMLLPHATERVLPSDPAGDVRAEALRQARRRRPAARRRDQEARKRGRGARDKAPRREGTAGAERAYWPRSTPGEPIGARDEAAGSAGDP